MDGACKFFNKIRRSQVKIFILISMHLIRPERLANTVSEFEESVPSPDKINSEGCWKLTVRCVLPLYQIFGPCCFDSSIVTGDRYKQFLSAIHFQCLLFHPQTELHSETVHHQSIVKTLGINCKTNYQTRGSRKKTISHGLLNPPNWITLTTFEGNVSKIWSIKLFIPV